MMLKRFSEIALALAIAFVVSVGTMWFFGHHLSYTPDIRGKYFGDTIYYHFIDRERNISFTVEDTGESIKVTRSTYEQ